MASISTTLPASLRPWRQEENEQESLKSILARINEERGHFRLVTEESLQAEIATEDTEEDRPGEDSADEEEETKEPDTKTRREELYAARAEMIQNVASAHNEALMALDFVSLLMTKDAPRQGELTMSPFLKQQVKPGTLGIDAWHNVQPDREQEQKDEVLAKGWRIQSLQASADSLLSAATRLNNNVKRETQYWEQVLAVSERGWSICRMRGERNNLGVRFGFSEAMGEFKERGLAALRADEEGNVVLDKGLGADPKSLRVRIQQGDRTVGVSRVPVLAVEEETTVEARIRHARDSLYEEEIFQEIIRESRMLGSYGVKMIGSTISLPTCLNGGEGFKDQRTLLIDLVPLKDADQQGDASDEDNTAQAIVLGFRLLLSRTHAERLKQRSQIPPPMSANKRETQTAQILRPVLAFLQHRRVLTELNGFLSRVTTIFQRASIEHTASPATFDFQEARQAESADALVSSLIAPLRSSSKLTIPVPGAEGSLDFDIEVFTSVSAPSFGSNVKVTSPVGPSPSEFADVAELAETMDATISGALARGMGLLLSEWTVDEEDAELQKAASKAGKTRKANVGFVSGVQKSGEEQEGSLVLVYGRNEKRQWSSGTEGVQKGFWQVVDDIREGKLA
ncbi:RNA polymerase II mediator complex subunit [Zalaria obscura]|uniref:RNA polymerase II mediator complex subunit n=1 Tax=Zalaria obscura TaxID=2024903 RepID=A0ACC3S2Z4_9PEZI